MKKPQPLSREFLLNRGFCCNNGCTNCPYKMAQLHETLMGKKLIEGTLPEIALQLKRIADSLENKKDVDQINSAFQAFIKNYPNDEDLGKNIRQLWQK
jgi:hypothetical protein